jgi:Ca-activated chloride channel family protein
VSDLSWADGLWRWIALAAVPFCILLFVVDDALRRRALERLGKARLVEEMASSRSTFRRLVKIGLFTAGISLALLALAQPQIPDKKVPEEARGIDIAIALDFSKSMLADDIKPTRLEAAKDELWEHLLKNLAGERVALVAFAGEAIRYPLTTDYNAVKLFWSELGPADMPVGGTALGLAIKSAIRSLVAGREPGKDRDQVIVLVTDGEDTEGGDTMEAAKEAAKLGIRVYTVGIGASGFEGARVPEVDENGRPTGIKRNPDGSEVRSKLDEKTLIDVAQATSGTYYPFGRGLEPMAAELSTLKKAVTKKKASFRVDAHEQLFKWLLFPAFVLILVDTVMRERRRTKRVAGGAS